MPLEGDLEKYLKDNKVDAKDIAKSMRASFDLVMYGEVHVGLTKKAEFFTKLIKDEGDRFHASEHFHNTVSVGDKVGKYLKGEIARSGLPSNLRALTPVLDAIKPKTSTTGLVFSGIKANAGRDRRIFDNFKASRALHLKAKRFGASDPGHFHIGAAHAARLPFGGSTPTTTQLLIKEGFNVGTVRLVVDVAGSSSISGTVLTIAPGEFLSLAPIAGGDPIDVLEIVKRVGAGNAFGVDLRKQSTPFAKVRPDESTSADGYHKYFDAIIFIP